MADGDAEPSSPELDPLASVTGSGAAAGARHALGELAAELETAEEAAAEQVNMVLTSVLDRLGSAHHRPFSRS